MKSLEATELESLGLLYRQAATDLSAVRGEPSAQVLEASLNRLVSRAHHFVYAGNLPGRVGDWEDTRCPNCRTVLIKRFGFEVLENRIPPDGACPRCHTVIPGYWRARAPQARESAEQLPVSGG